MSLKKKGWLLLCLSNLFFGFLPVTVKWSDQLHFSPVQVTFFRFAFATLGIPLLAGFLRWNDRPFLFSSYPLDDGRQRNPFELHLFHLGQRFFGPLPETKSP